MTALKEGDSISIQWSSNGENFDLSMISRAMTADQTKEFGKDFSKLLQEIRAKEMNFTQKHNANHQYILQENDINLLKKITAIENFDEIKTAKEFGARAPTKEYLDGLKAGDSISMTWQEKNGSKKVKYSFEEIRGVLKKHIIDEKKQNLVNEQSKKLLNDFNAFCNKINNLEMQR